jgi:hypothetical protein
MMGLDGHEPPELLRKAVGEALADLPLERLGVPPAFAERLMLFMAQESAPSLLEAQGDLLSPLIASLAGDARDKIRDSHNRALALPPEQTGWAGVLTEFTWCLEPALQAILPDCVALVREDTGELVPFLLSSAAAQAVLLPLAPDRILMGIRPGTAPVDLSGFNPAAAAACDSFFIAARPAAAGLTDLIGTRPGRAIREVVDGVFAGLEGLDSSRAGTSRPAATPATPRAFSYPVYCVGVGDEAAACDIARVVNVIVTELARTLPLSDLDGVTFAADYAEALRCLDRGDPDLPPI